MDKVALGQVFSEYLGFSLPILIPPAARHSSPIIWGWYNRPVLKKLKKSNTNKVTGLVDIDKVLYRVTGFRGLLQGD
jgi:hypothetical protein